MKTVVLVGLNYLTAPLGIREQVYLSDDKLQSALVEMQGSGLSEVVVLSTCNRLEIYGVADNVTEGSDLISAFLTQLFVEPIANLSSYLYFLNRHDAIHHLMRVACGLESLVLGETQILGQVADALAQAQIAATNGAILSRLFAAALHAGKRARTETAISQHSLSISHAAALLANSHFDDGASLKVLIVGAGEMAKLAARALLAQGVGRVWLINRTQEKADHLAAELGVESLAWSDISSTLMRVNVVIAATASALPIICVDHVSALVSSNRETPLLLVDIGVPRNIEPEIGNVQNCLLYDVDHLAAVVETNRQQRQAEVWRVEQLIVEEMEVFIEWFRTREIAPLINQLRSQAEAVAQSEVEQTLRRLPGLSKHEQAVLNQMAHRIVNKLLHAPTMNLKTRAADGDYYDYTHTVRQLFALDEHKSV